MKSFSLHPELDGPLVLAVGGADDGDQGIDPRLGVGREFKVDLLVVGAVMDAAVHGLGGAQGPALEEDLPGDGHRDAHLFRSEEGVRGLQQQGVPGPGPERLNADLIQTDDAAAGGAIVLLGYGFFPVETKVLPGAAPESPVFSIKGKLQGQAGNAPDRQNDEHQADDPAGFILC